MPPRGRKPKLNVTLDNDNGNGNGKGNLNQDEIYDSLINFKKRHQHKFDIQNSNTITIVIPSSIYDDVKFELNINNGENKWKIPILDNYHHSLSRILPKFNVLDIDVSLTNFDKQFKDLIELVDIIKIYNYCFNCGDMLDISGDKFMSCDKAECINICNSHLLDDYVTSEFQKNKTSPNLSVLEFIIKTAYWSSSSKRRDIIYDPKPIYLEKLALQEKKTIWDLLDKFQHDYSLTKIMKVLMTYETDLDLFNQIGEVGYAFIKFTLKSNNTIIFNGNLINSSDITSVLNGGKYSQEMIETFIDNLGDKCINLTQFSVQHPQQMETKFKKANETCYLYHGSKQENWYSIMRNGLKIGSANKLQVNGAVHGNGIYLSDTINLSIGYSNSQNIIVGVCQVIENAKKWFKTNNIFVVPEENLVMLKYLLVFPPSNTETNQSNMAIVQSVLMNILNKKFVDNIQQEQSAKQCQLTTLRSKRLMREYKALISKDEKELGFRIELIKEDSLDLWKIYIKNSGFEGNINIQKDMEKYGIKEVELEFRFNENYPVQPPFVRIVAPRFIYRTGHITLGGSICMELLTNQGWDMTTSVSTVITYIKSAIMDGEGQIDPANYKNTYSMSEAVDAFNRMLKSHGWK
jgi:ubiquitin-protein ligase